MKGRNIAFGGLLIALALILSYVEVLFPLPVGIPGIKLGLANLVVFITLYSFGVFPALGISLARILISGFAFGGMHALLYSLAGGMLSFLGMVLLKQTGKFSPVTVSIFGGVLHNIGQLLVAYLVLENAAIAAYLPVLLVAGVICGSVIGLLGDLIRKRIAPLLKKHKDQ